MNRTPPPEQPIPRQVLQTGAPGFLWALVGLMVAIELTLILSDAGLIGSKGWRWSAFQIGAFWQPLLSGEMAQTYPGQTILMFVTYAFLHDGIVHLAMNCVVLLALGKFSAARIGKGKTLLVLFLSAVGGGLAFGLLATSLVPMIGASGAVFGLIGLWQAWDYRMRQQSGLPLQPVVMAILALVAANLVFFIILDGGLAWEAHFGGWLVGWISGRSFARSNLSGA